MCNTHIFQNIFMRIELKFNKLFETNSMSVLYYMQ